MFARLTSTCIRLLERGIVLKLNAPFIVAYQGPAQLFRPTIVPICGARRSRAGPLLKRAFNPFATVGSVVADAGLNTKARSFENPSPLMSPATIGVYAKPDVVFSAVVMPNEPPKNIRAY